MKLPTKKIKKEFSSFYKKNYKHLLIIPILLLISSIIIIGLTYQKTGSPINRDISLKGGLSVIFEAESKLTSYEIEDILKKEFLNNDFAVNDFSKNGKQAGYIIDTDLEEDKLIKFLENKLEFKIDKNKNYQANYISQSLSNSFFKQALIILSISLILMAIVVFLYFRAYVPSCAVILSAIFDIIVLVGFLNLINFKISIAGIGAIIMIIGYSIDTDILLTNRLYKEKGTNYFEKLYEAFVTGNLMSLTTLCAGLSAMILTNSNIIFEISFILVVGLIIDYISTWIQNTSILLIWLD
jgi:preprotein translocase subunit SecF